VTTPPAGHVLALGLMSGTSADGIDAALVEVERVPRAARLVHFGGVAYPAALRRRVLAAAHGDAVTPELCRLHAELGEAFGRAALELCRQAGCPPEEVAVVGSHGQTVWHAPEARPGATMQLGAPALIARITGRPVVSDFRAADLACGGQGAPLTPVCHHLLFAHAGLDRAVANIGGIANVTRLPAGKGAEAVTAMDVGPGNMVIDAVVAHLTGGREVMDADGRMAHAGRPHAGLLEALLAHPFFSAPGPKSTGRETFGEGYVADLLERGRALDLAPEDLVATVTALTAHGVAAGVTGLGGAAEVLLCGGGARNPALEREIARRLPGVRVAPTDVWGVPAQAVEAIAFAELAARTLWGEPGNLPVVTGAAAAVVLGSVTPAAVGPGQIDRFFGAALD
jgi:anhydro-N-acetylmuramic acid kinase